MSYPKHDAPCPPETADLCVICVRARLRRAYREASIATALLVEAQGRFASVRSALRFAMRRGLPATLTLREWNAACRFFGGCAYCGEPGGFTLDHVLPLSQGGGTTRGNCVPACLTCNDRKRGRALPELANDPAFPAAKIRRIQRYLKNLQ